MWTILSGPVHVSPICVWNSVAKTEESVEEKTELKKETVEKITVEEEEKIIEEEIEPAEQRAKESGPEGNTVDRGEPNRW